MVEGEDWIAAFNNGDVCVGARVWNGEFTDIPAMGFDNTFETQGYMTNGDIATFKIYDGSTQMYYNAESSINDGWIAFEFINVDYINVVRDCNDDLGGFAFLDDCGVCSGGNSGHEENSDDVGCGCFEPEAQPYWYDADGDGLGSESQFYCLQDIPLDWVNNDNDTEPNCATNDTDECGVCAGGNIDQDCNGDCFGLAFYDDCGICSGGNSGHEENSDDVGCGCFEPEAQPYWYDADGDGLGSGNPIEYCTFDVPDNWTSVGNDPEPFCSTNDTDECGICGGDGIPLGDCDCYGNIDLGCGCGEAGPSGCDNTCGSTLDFDDCGVCGGDNSSCSGCVDSLALNFDSEATISDGSCDYPVYGCLDPLALNYNSDADLSNGDCDYLPEVGISFGSIDATNSTIEIYSSTDKDLSEISFSISGATITGASQGFDLNTSTTSNSFNASGNIEDGGGLLTILSFTDGSGEFCLTSGSATAPGYDAINLTLGGCAVFVGTDGGVVSSDDAGVDIPAGALTESESIAVGDVTEELPEEVDNATGFEVEEMTAFTPFDIVFEEPVEISISYGDDTRNNRNDEFLCYLEDASDTEWAVVDGATCADGVCIADVDSFGIFATCILIEDCNGDLGGYAYLDDCGDCVGGDTGNDANYNMDECGLCGGPGFIDWYIDADGDNLGYGDGVPFCSDIVPDGYVPNDSDAEPNCATNDTDECGLCGGDGAEDGFDCDGNCIADGGYDCSGVCGGSSENDDCGICGGDNSTCTDCNGDINGSAYTDGCGDCVGGNSGVGMCYRL